MQFRSLLAVAAGLASFVAANPLAHEAEYLEDTKRFWKRQDPAKPCATGVHIIAVSGDGIDNKGSTGDLNTTYAAFKNAIPGSTHRNLPYPKGSPNGLAKTVVGEGNMRRWIQEYHDACPKTKMVLLGYSSGAIITMNTLCGASPSPPWPYSAPLDSSFADVIIATVVYGDETFVGGQPYDVGTCTGKGRFPRTNLAGCNAFASGIQSYCGINDPQCCLGDDGSAHFAYPGEYDNAAVAWIQSRYHAAMNK